MSGNPRSGNHSSGNSGSEQPSRRDRYQRHARKPTSYNTDLRQEYNEIRYTQTHSNPT